MAKKRRSKSKFGLPHLVVIAVVIVAAYFFMTNSTTVTGQEYYPVLDSGAEVAGCEGLSQYWCEMCWCAPGEKAFWKEYPYPQCACP